MRRYPAVSGQPEPAVDGGRGKRYGRRVRRIAPSLIGTAALAAAGAAPAPAADVRIAEVHVTQGIQTVATSTQLGNQLPLVAHRSTAVRVRLATSDGSRPQDVTGRLHLFVDGQEITAPEGRVARNQPLDVDPLSTGLMDRDGETLNFELSFAERLRLQPASGLGTTSADFRVDLTAPGDTNAANDANDHRARLEGLTVRRQPTTTIYFVRIRYTPFGTDIPDEAFVRRGRGDALMVGALPLDDSCRACLYRQGPPDLDFTVDDDSDERLDFVNGVNDEADQLLDQLIEMRSTLANEDVAPSETTFLYGWVPSGALSGHNGVGHVDGSNVAYGRDLAAGGQGTFAHELTHNFGLIPEDTPGVNVNSQGRGTFHWDSPRTLAPDVGWDVGNRLFQNPAANNVTTQVKRGTLQDVMNNAGPLTNQRWMTATTAQLLLGQPQLDPTGAPDRPCLPSARRTLSLLGRLRGRIQLPVAAGALRAFTYDWCTGTRAGRAGAAAGARAAGRSKEQPVAEVRLRRRGGVRTVRVPVGATQLANLHDVPGRTRRADPTALGGFHVNVPLRYGERAESVRILTPAGRALATLRRSGRAPVPRIGGLETGTRLGRRTALRWRVADADTPRAALRHQVLYSPDGGRDWVPVAVGLRGTRLVFDAARLPLTAPGRGVLRVYTTDGLNSGVAQVGRLSLRSAGYVLEDPVPRAR